MEDETRKKIEGYAKECCDKYKDDRNLYSGHTLLVRKYALILAEIENADKDVVEVAALLHDIGKVKGRENHAERSFEMAKEFLADLNIENKELILKCVLKHGSKNRDEDDEIEVKVIQSADGLGVLFDEDWQEKSRKTKTKEELLKLYDKVMYKKLNLESAKKIARPEYERLVDNLSG